MKNLKTLLLIMILSAATATVSLAQRKDIAKLQAPREYPTYASKWIKNEVKAVRSFKSDAKESARAARKRHRILGKIQRIKESTQAISARKEASND